MLNLVFKITTKNKIWFNLSRYKKVYNNNFIIPYVSISLSGNFCYYLRVYHQFFDIAMLQLQCVLQTNLNELKPIGRGDIHTISLNFF